MTNQTAPSAAATEGDRESLFALPSQARPLAAANWERLLSSALGLTLRVRYTRSRRQVVRLESGAFGHTRTLKLHFLFAHAPAAVQAELIDWVRHPRRRRAASAMDAWLENQLAQLSAPVRRQDLQSKGLVHDLETIQAEVIAKHLESAFQAQAHSKPRITWTRAARSRTRHSLRLGCFDRATNLIRVHWVLDREWVPMFFVEYVVFHELLHALLGEEAGPHRHHGARFRAQERTWPELERALAWERAHVDRLIDLARSGPRKTAPAPRAWPARLAAWW